MDYSARWYSPKPPPVQVTTSGSNQWSNHFAGRSTRSRYAVLTREFISPKITLLNSNTSLIQQRDFNQHPPTTEEMDHWLRHPEEMPPEVAIMISLGLFVDTFTRGVQGGVKIVKSATEVVKRGWNSVTGLFKGKAKVVNGFEATVHSEKQGKHIPGHPNYQPGKSIFTGDSQKLLDTHAGKGQWIGQNKERVDFGQVIGKYVDPNTGQAIETTKGIIHYSKKGAHIVPSRP